MPDTATNPARTSNGWQLVLADLALILFLISACVLATRNEGHASAAGALPSAPHSAGGEALSQAIWRSGPDMPGDAASLSEWLAEQARDPRATLRITAVHRPGDEARIWEKAREMVASAAAANMSASVVIRSGSQTGIEARLVYDGAPGQARPAIADSKSPANSR